LETQTLQGSIGRRPAGRCPTQLIPQQRHLRQQHRTHKVWEGVAGKRMVRWASDVWCGMMPASMSGCACAWPVAVQHEALASWIWIAGT